MKVFCTYFDHNYLPRGLALHGSLQEHCPEFQLWVLCLTPECYAALTQLALPEVRLITLDDLERFEPRLAAAKQNRTTIEYFFTCTPTLPLFVFESEPAAVAVTYVDGDMLVFHPLDEVWHEIADNSIAIVAHRFPPALQGLERWGVFNVGWLTFRRDANARTCLEWWRDRCLEWCYDRLEDGRFADQKYLDDWPERFSGVKVISHPGVNLAPWNLGGHQLGFENDRITVDGRPLLIFHFHGLKQRARSLFDPQLLRYSVQADEFLRKQIYAPYFRKLATLAGKAGLRKENAGLNVRGIAVNDPSRELSLREKWIECDRLRHEPGFGGFMAASPASLGVVMALSNDLPRLSAHLSSIASWIDLVDEIVVVVRNSTDETIKFVREKLRNPRLRILPHTGTACEAWNFGIAQLGSDFTYLSKVGDTITREGMNELLTTAQKFACDIAITPSVRTSVPRAESKGYPCPLETILEDVGAAKPIHIRRCRMMDYAAHFALNGGLQPALGNIVGNLFRTEMLQAMPFPNDSGLSGETMWRLRNLLATSVVITPIRCTEDYFHRDECDRGDLADAELQSSQIRRTINQAIEEALIQTSASDRDDLLRLRELIETRIRANDLRRLHLALSARLDALRSGLSFPALSILDPRSWGVRWKRGRLKKQLLETEATEARIRSQIA